MPLVEVTHRADLDDAALVVLGAALPHAVSLAVACEAEPYEPPLRPGDVEIRFRSLGPLDRSGLDVVIEVRSTWQPDRVENRRERAELLRDLLLDATTLTSVGVFLTLPVAGWSQT